MNKEIDFSYLGIPDEQIEKIKKHLKTASKHVYKDDPGQTDSFVWIKDNLSQLPSEYSEVLYGILEANKPDPAVSYIEEGYDSCQSHRKISKIIGESLLLGGLVYEFGLLGIKIDIEKAKTIIKSNLVIYDNEAKALPEIAKKYGANQDFLFPGVTPSSIETASLEEYAYLVLLGKPITSVRSLLGVGGIRFDKDWNWATDFSTFVNLKIEEDKRYYPGIGIYFALLNSDSNGEMVGNKASFDLIQAVKSVQKKEYQGVSVLCSAYIPSWGEMKQYQHNAGYDSIELAESFHSPAYDFSHLLTMYEKNDFSQIKKFIAKLGNIWSFNSTIHLPWTSELAGLSNDLIGSITNEVGDHAIRYGVGWSNMSLEIKEYHFGQQRKFPADVSDKVAYGLFFYPESGSFQGKVEKDSFIPGSKFWEKVKKDGFMAGALEKLKG